MIFVKAQSAMEYLTTYGWAILVLGVVLAVLFSLGLFSNQTPKALQGQCSVLRPNGPASTFAISLQGVCSGEEPETVAIVNSIYTRISGTVPVSLNILPNATLSIWVRPNDTNGGDLFYYNAGAPCAQATYSLGSGLYPTWMLRYGLAIWSFTGNTPLVPGKWSFVSFSTTSNGNEIITVNGNATEGAPSYSTVRLCPPLHSAVVYSIGAGLDGQLSNLQVYNATFPENGLLALYYEGIGGTPIRLTNLVGWWPLNSDAQDYSGNGNNATTVKNVTFSQGWTAGYTMP